MPRKPPRKSGDPPIRDIDYTISDSGCWVWNWPVHPKGYASVRVDGHMRKAHRVAYESAYGPIPDGQQIRHVCHNPSCVNPEHLQAGTQTDNSRDMVAAGNQTDNSRDMVAAGNQHHQKLTWDDAIEIRRVFGNGGISRAELARRYNVSPRNVNLIVRNKTFHDETYVPPPPPKRRPRGSLRGVLNEDLAKEIRHLYLAGGVSQLKLAEKYHLNEAIISALVGGKLYSDPDYRRPPRRAHNQKLTKGQADVVREKTDSGVASRQLAEE